MSDYYIFINKQKHVSQVTNAAMSELKSSSDCDMRKLLGFNF